MDIIYYSIADPLFNSQALRKVQQSLVNICQDSHPISFESTPHRNQKLLLFMSKLE